MPLIPGELELMHRQCVEQFVRNHNERTIRHIRDRVVPTHRPTLKHRRLGLPQARARLDKVDA